MEQDIFFIEQKEFGVYVVDFYLPEYRLVIEADGVYWHGKKAKPEEIQRKRRDILATKALIVVRLSEEDIKSGRFADSIREGMERYEQAWKDAFPFSSDTKDRAPSLQ